MLTSGCHLPWCPHTHAPTHTHMHIHKHKERMGYLGYGPAGRDRMELWMTLNNLMLGPSLVTWPLYSQGQISKHLWWSGFCLLVCSSIYHKLGRKNLNWGITSLDWTVEPFLSNGRCWGAHFTVGNATLGQMVQGCVTKPAEKVVESKPAKQLSSVTSASVLPSVSLNWNV